MIYTPEELGHVTMYAKYRGVRVILELDSPSHVGAGWEWGPYEGLGNITVCVNRQPWRDFCIQPPCGQINPVNPNVYDVLRDIYSDVLGVMGASSVLHLGGDEVYINCWNATPEVTSVMESRGMGRRNEDFLQLWAEFHATQARVLNEVKGGRNDSTILWSSALTSPDVIERYLDKTTFVVQTWLEATSEIPAELLRLGYRLIVSTKNAWYLDHGFWGKTQYHSWRDAYNNRIPTTVRLALSIFRNDFFFFAVLLITDFFVIQLFTDLQISFVMIVIIHCRKECWAGKLACGEST